MCGRYSNHVDAMRTWIRILGDWPQDVLLSYNVTPSRTIPVFTAQAGLGMRWGLIPHWSKEGKVPYATFNARSESIESKPAFRSAWKKLQRCLIPAQGFFEWRQEAGIKQPYFIRSLTDDPFVFAGLWDRWKGDQGEWLTCSVITRPSDGVVKDLHPRMPVIVKQSHAGDWLHGSPQAAKQILFEEPIALRYHKVSSAVNNPRNDGPELIEQVEERR